MANDSEPVRRVRRGGNGGAIRVPEQRRFRRVAGFAAPLKSNCKKPKVIAGLYHCAATTFKPNLQGRAISYS